MEYKLYTHVVCCCYNFSAQEFTHFASSLEATVIWTTYMCRFIDLVLILFTIIYAFVSACVYACACA